MPIRNAVASDRAGIISCINSMWAYLRTSKGITNLTDWNVATFNAYAAAGHEAWVYARPTGRIDAVCIWSVRNLTRPPDVTPQPWMHVPILVVRASAITTTAERRKHYLRGIALAVPDAVVNQGCVGVFCEYDARHIDLHNVLAEWTRAEFETTPVGPDGSPALEVFYVRVQPGLPELTVAAAGLNT